MSISTSLDTQNHGQLNNAATRAAEELRSGYDSHTDTGVTAASAVRLAALPAIGSFVPGKSYREIRSDFEAEFERRYVKWLLERHNGNISAASREARMDRKHLFELARKHGLRGEKS